MSRLKTHNSLTVGHRDRPQPSPTFHTISSPRGRSGGPSMFNEMRGPPLSLNILGPPLLLQQTAQLTYLIKAFDYGFHDRTGQGS